MFEKEKFDLQQKWEIISSYKNNNCIFLKAQLSRETERHQFYGRIRKYSEYFDCEDKMEEIKRQMKLKNCDTNLLK